MNVPIIAIAGGSGSGKTWLAQHLAEEFGAAAGRLSLDDFYRDRSQQAPEDRAQANFDHPDAIDWPEFRRSLMAIRRGEALELPVYDFSSHTRSAVTKAWKPCRLVLLDGLWLLHRVELRRLYSLGVFVDCPESLRRERRLARDQQERGRSAASIRAQFDGHVAPMHDRFVAPQVQHADLVVASPAPSPRLAELRERCRQFLILENPA